MMFNTGISRFLLWREMHASKVDLNTICILSNKKQLAISFVALVTAVVRMAQELPPALTVPIPIATSSKSVSVVTLMSMMMRKAVDNLTKLTPTEMAS